MARSALHALARKQRLPIWTPPQGPSSSLPPRRGLPQPKPARRARVARPLYAAVAATRRSDACGERARDAAASRAQAQPASAAYVARGRAARAAWPTTSPSASRRSIVSWEQHDGETCGRPGSRCCSRSRCTPRASGSRAHAAESAADGAKRRCTGRTAQSRSVRHFAPCPPSTLSKSSRLKAVARARARDTSDFAWRVLILLNLFRLTIGTLLLAVFYLVDEPRIVGETDPELARVALLGMLGVGCAELVLLRRRLPGARGADLSCSSAPTSRRSRF